MFFILLLRLGPAKDAHPRHHETTVPSGPFEHPGALGRKARLPTERFRSIIARKPSVSRRFLRFLLYPFIEPALLPLHRACFHPTSNRREDFRGPLVLEPAHGADLGCLELLRQLF